MTPPIHPANPAAALLRFAGRETLTSPLSPKFYGLTENNPHALEAGDTLIQFSTERAGKNPEAQPYEVLGTVVSLDPHHGEADSFGKVAPENSFTREGGTRQGDDKLDMLTLQLPTGETKKYLVGTFYDHDRETGHSHYYYDLTTTEKPKYGEASGPLSQYYSAPSFASALFKLIESKNRSIAQLNQIIGVLNTKIAAFKEAFVDIGRGQEAAQAEKTTAAAAAKNAKP
ncbi:MAG: hypothetical protein SFZ03_01590 [Candidatus Melainabacteria bacterium]|nr:hypothetical protein [Candidatus Melainabacteria bacterium]